MYTLKKRDSRKYFEPYYLHIDSLFTIVLTVYYFCDQRSIICLGCNAIYSNTSHSLEIFAVKKASCDQEI